MEETLITFETAKLAKQKGLNLKKCNAGWHGDFGDLKNDSYPFLGTYSFYNSVHCDNSIEYHIQRPTQSLLQKWLREVHNIDVLPTKIGTTNNKKYYFKVMMHDHWMNTENSNSTTFLTYEEALEIALQEALKLIK